MTLIFEWDSEKARTNLAKHGIAFDIAVQVFDDPDAISEMERVVDGEQRWRTVGRIGFTTVLFVGHTWVDEDGQIYVRMITARKATKHEIKGYEAGDERYLR
jgi:uncharacterized DUF497 family protein